MHSYVSSLTSLTQGMGKTAWCQRLLPPELQNYYISGSPRFGQRDTLIAMSRVCLYNIDEYDVFGPKQVNLLKEMTSKPTIDERAA
ncbi:MAG: hypothetical protein LBQ78_08410, partial [Tannerellaceae bacterium]|nr:hypothetical protein [Tannerellaceae bacterium]